MKTVLELFAAAAFFVFAVQGALAQEPALPVGADPAVTAPVDGLPQAEEKSWLMRSPLVDIGWPEIKMPKFKWKTEDATAATTEAAAGPLQKMTDATRNAFTRTRTAWNGAIDKMKIGPFAPKDPNAEPGFFAKLFNPAPAEKPKSAGIVADAVGGERPDYR